MSIINIITHSGLEAKDLVGKYTQREATGHVKDSNYASDITDEILNPNNSTNNNKEQREVGKLLGIYDNNDSTEEYDVHEKGKSKGDEEKEKRPSLIAAVMAAEQNLKPQQTSTTEENKEESEVVVTAAVVEKNAEVEQEDELLDQIEKQPVLEEEEEAKMVEDDTPVDTPLPVTESVPEKEQETEEQDDQSTKKKRCALLLLILVTIIALATVIGIMVGKNSNNDANKALESDIIGTGAAGETSSSPTASPIGYCPSTHALFTIKSSSTTTGVGGDDDEEGSMILQGSTDDDKNINTTKSWVLRDSCTGVEVMRCLPCSSNFGSNSADSGSSDSGGGGNLFDIDGSSSSTTTTTTTTTNVFEFDNTCIGKTDRPRPIRDGERFRFNLLVVEDDETSSNLKGSSGQCVNSEGLEYGWGRFDNVGE